MPNNRACNYLQHCSHLFVRAQISVTTASLDHATTVKCSRGVSIVTDTTLHECVRTYGAFHLIVLPGGLGGTEAMVMSPLLGCALRAQEREGRLVAAICAAPLALQAHRIALGRRLTSYPAMRDRLAGDYEYVDGEPVVQDGNLVTSRGPGTSFAFALRLAELLAGKEKAAEVAKGMLL